MASASSSWAASPALGRLGGGLPAPDAAPDAAADAAAAHAGIPSRAGGFPWAESSRTRTGPGSRGFARDDMPPGNATRACRFNFARCETNGGLGVYMYDKPQDIDVVGACFVLMDSLPVSDRDVPPVPGGHHPYLDRSAARSTILQAVSRHAYHLPS